MIVLSCIFSWLGILIWLVCGDRKAYVWWLALLAHLSIHGAWAYYNYYGSIKTTDITVVHKKAFVSHGRGSLFHTITSDKGVVYYLSTCDSELNKAIPTIKVGGRYSVTTTRGILYRSLYTLKIERKQP